jgi:hypothetical protein
MQERKLQLNTVEDLVKLFQEQYSIFKLLSEYEALDSLKSAMYVTLAASGLSNGINYCLDQKEALPYSSHSLTEINAGIYADDTGSIFYNELAHKVDYSSNAKLSLAMETQPISLVETLHFRYKDPVAPAIQPKLVTIENTIKTNIILHNARKQFNIHTEPSSTAKALTRIYLELKLVENPVECTTRIAYHGVPDKAPKRLENDAVALLSNVLSGIKNTRVEEIVTLMAVDHLSLVGIQVDPKTRRDLQALAINLC